MVFGVIFAGLECFFNYPPFRNHYETQLYKSHRSTSQCIKGYDSSLSVCSVSCTVQLQLFTRGEDNSLPVCSVSCTVHLQLFTKNDMLQVRPESTFNKQKGSTLSVQFMAYKISNGLSYIITLYTITSLISVHHHSVHYILVGVYAFSSLTAVLCRDLLNLGLWFIRTSIQAAKGCPNKYGNSVTNSISYF